MLANMTNRILSGCSGVGSASDSGLADFQACAPKPMSLILSCPQCGAKKEAADRWLYKPTGACSLFCVTCNRFITSRRWQCACKLPWIRCETHRAVGFACRGRRRLRLKPKRALPSSFEVSMPRRKARRLEFDVPNHNVFGG